MAASGNVRYSQVRSGDRSGTGVKIATVTGTLTVDKQLKFDANGNVVASAIDIGGGSGVGLIHLGSQTASASSSLNFTSLISSTYNVYMITIEDLVVATNAAYLWFRVSTDNGSSYVSTGDYNWHFLQNSGAGTALASGGSANEIQCSEQIWNSTNTIALNGTFWLFNPLGTALWKTIRGECVHTYPSDTIINNMQHLRVFGVYKQTTAVNAFQFLMSTGNITSGVIRLYGLAKS